MFTFFPTRSMNAIRLVSLKNWSLIGILFGLIIAAQAHAVGGMLTIKQTSNTQQLGTWTLSTPEGKTYIDHRGYVQKIEPVVGGTYALTIDAPRKARTSVVVYRGNNEVIRSVEGTSLSFTVPGGEAVRVIITYRFFGTINVTSDPSGQSFVLQGSDTIMYTGKTPETFNNIPPLYYVLQFGHLENCRTPRKQSRLLDPNESITFYGVYECVPALTVGETEPEPQPEEPEVTQPTSKLIGMSLRANQNEVLPGGVVQYTLIVRNPDKATMEDVSISVQTDTKLASVARVHDGGKVQGNLAVWKVPEIFAGKHWSTQFTLKANDDLAVGDQITLTARISSPGLIEAGATEHQLTQSQSVGVVSLPATGWMSDLFFALFTLGAGLILAISIRRRQLVVPNTA